MVQSHANWNLKYQQMKAQGGRPIMLMTILGIVEAPERMVLGHSLPQVDTPVALITAKAVGTTHDFFVCIEAGRPNASCPSFETG